MAPVTTPPPGYNLVLLSIVFVTLPLTTLLLWANYAAAVLTNAKTRFTRRQKQVQRRCILITGAATVQGLNIARAFHKEGHKVIGADVKGLPWLNIAKRSTAISKHYDVPRQSATFDADYLSRCILIIVKKENVDLWIDCSQDLSLTTVASARAEVEERTTCACFTANADGGNYLQNKEAFIEFLKAKNMPTSELHKVKTRSEIHNILNESQGKKQYVLKRNMAVDRQILLPRRTLSQTYHDVSLVKITPDSHMVLEEYLDSTTTYQCSAIVVQGEVKLFWARQMSGENNTNLSTASALGKALRGYTIAVGRALGPELASHLTLRFGLSEKITNSGVEQQILPIEGSLSLDPTFLLSARDAGSHEMINAYLSILKSPTNGTTKLLMKNSGTSSSIAGTNLVPSSRYFLLEDIRKLLLESCMSFLQRRTSFQELWANFGAMLYRLLFWDEAYYDFRDPLPAFWLYTVVFMWTILVGFG